MILISLLKKLKSKIKTKFFNSNSPSNVDDICNALTVLPGIGSKNSLVFYEAGFTTPQSIIDAKDEDLLALPGIGVNFIKKLRNKKVKK